MNDPLPPTLRRLAFRCPRCSAVELELAAEVLRCRACPATFALRGGKIYFEETAGAEAADPLSRVKAPFKRFPRLYGFLVGLLSPLYFDNTRRRFVARRVAGRPGVFLNLGSGNARLAPNVVNVDRNDFDHVDLVCDVVALPLQDRSVDGVLSISVLEHVPEPERVMEEVHRVLRPGGFVYTDVPFVVGYHASPGDYRRWTHEGVRRLHHRFETERVINNGGPTSALLWVFQEWVAVLLSFGSRRLHAVVYLIVMCLTFPLKFLDALLKHSPLAPNVSSCFIYIGRKPPAVD